MARQIQEQYAFYEQMRAYYLDNRARIRRGYKDLTRKFLDYNDREKNPEAFLRRPQFEALEMYVFIKEYLDNQQVYAIFDDWRNRRGKFEDASFYGWGGQVGLLDELTDKQTETLFGQMKRYSETYPNYIYALTMGLGKTILMATCIFYEFLLANKYPSDGRFCHNALVFAPDKTVLQSLKEMVTFNKALVVPPEYARVLDANLKIYFLEDSGGGLNTLDGSDFNMVISNTQKIIVKKRHGQSGAVERLFDGQAGKEEELTFNQRFHKLCRLPGLGIFVDEAHHLFGNELEKSLRSNKAETSLRSTINLLAAALAEQGTRVVACHNYTGTPYVKNQLLPEVVYAYGLKESIRQGYLKDADIQGFHNVKNKEFLRAAITRFWQRYGGKEYEGLLPKMAIFASGVEEADREVRPMVEEILAELAIPASKVLVNVGDTSITKNDDLRHFNELDVPGSQGNEKQFLILVEKGREGWNCRSLFGVALFRNPKSRIFVLQATMRCLRSITGQQQTASVFLSKDNFDILDEELHKNFNVSMEDLKKGDQPDRVECQVRVRLPGLKLPVRQVRHRYTLRERGYCEPVGFGLEELDWSRYEALIYEKQGLSQEMTVKMQNADAYRQDKPYSAYTLTAAAARYLRQPCALVRRMLEESREGMETVLQAVNRYNRLLPEVIVPGLFHGLYLVEGEICSEPRELELLRQPEQREFYTFSARRDLVVRYDDPAVKPYRDKSFHADTYCFDSVSEKELFWQYLTSKKVERVYFTGMFTGQGDLGISYIHPETGKVALYYPDFVAWMKDGTCQLIEVKGDDKADDRVVQAKAEAARELARESRMEYRLYLTSEILRHRVLG